ncbi:MAG: hypothetical protein Ta2E_02420 [Mycoplasmoidaceae bacterium]|nr:MAG: hypothetical protein Ta2E_02420 [Mycoplasmoidaceae bacterium]
MSMKKHFFKKTISLLSFSFFIIVPIITSCKSITLNYKYIEYVNINDLYANNNGWQTQYDFGIKTNDPTSPDYNYTQGLPNTRTDMEYTDVFTHIQAWERVNGYEGTTGNMYDQYSPNENSSEKYDWNGVSSKTVNDKSFNAADSNHLTISDLKNFKPSYHVGPNNQLLSTYDTLSDGSIVLRRWGGEFRYGSTVHSGVRLNTTWNNQVFGAFEIETTLPNYKYSLFNWWMNSTFKYSIDDAKLDIYPTSTNTLYINNPDDPLWEKTSPEYIQEYDIFETITSDYWFTNHYTSPVEKFHSFKKPHYSLYKSTYVQSRSNLYQYSNLHNPDNSLQTIKLTFFWTPDAYYIFIDNLFFYGSRGTHNMMLKDFALNYIDLVNHGFRGGSKPSIETDGDHYDEINIKHLRAWSNDNFTRYVP